MATNLPLRYFYLNKTFFRLPPPVRQSLLRSQVSTPSIYLRRRPASTTSSPQSTQNFVPPPSETSGPLLERLPNRALPDHESSFSWTRTFPLFLLICTISSFAIFNYQKSSSSTVSSILYALRTNPAVRELLGDEIYFASKVPWISGELNPLQGNIDISFWVKGTKGQGVVKFVSIRRKREKYFETLEWSLKTDDGREVQLLDLANAEDPMKGVEEKLPAMS